jgi:hypothetical protein
MNAPSLSTRLALEEVTEKLGKKAMELGLISSFVVRYFPDSWEFYIPNGTESNFFTPEAAYLYLKKLLGLDVPLEALKQI